jgi:hypothetical protein
MQVLIDLSTYYEETAKLSDIPEYIKRIKQEAGQGNDIILTGRAPIWLFLIAAHAVHGLARSLYYRSPVTGDVKIFDHNPF